MLAVIDNDELMERAIIEAERIIGDLYQPDTGLMFTIPIDRVIGLLHQEGDAIQMSKSISRPPDSMTETELITRTTAVAVVNKILNLTPVVVAVSCHDVPLRAARKA